MTLKNAGAIEWAQGEWARNPALRHCFGDFHAFWENYTADVMLQGLEIQRHAAGFHADSEQWVALAEARVAHARFPITAPAGCWPVADRNGSRLTLWVYGRIKFAQEVDSYEHMHALLDNSDAAVVVVRIASFGGGVRVALDLAAGIRRHRGTTVAIVDYNCWSAASLVAAACDRVFVRSSATMMIHKSWQCVAGNVDAALAMVSTLKEFDAVMARSISRGRKLPLPRVLKLMEGAAFHTASGAVRNGLADDIIPDLPPLPSPVPAGEPSYQRTLENDYVSAETKA